MKLIAKHHRFKNGQVYTSIALVLALTGLTLGTPLFQPFSPYAPLLRLRRSPNDHQQMSPPASFSIPIIIDPILATEEEYKMEMTRPGRGSVSTFDLQEEEVKEEDVSLSDTDNSAPPASTDSINYYSPRYSDSDGYNNNDQCSSVEGEQKSGSTCYTPTTAGEEKGIDGRAMGENHHHTQHQQHHQHHEKHHDQHHEKHHEKYHEQHHEKHHEQHHDQHHQHHSSATGEEHFSREEEHMEHQGHQDHGHKEHYCCEFLHPGKHSPKIRPYSGKHHHPRHYPPYHRPRHHYRHRHNFWHPAEQHHYQHHYVRPRPSHHTYGRRGGEGYQKYHHKQKPRRTRKYNRKPHHPHYSKYKKNSYSYPKHGHKYSQKRYKY